MNNDIRTNIESILNRIACACDRAGRSQNEVQLLLATKTVSEARILMALNAGCTLIAENRVQELKEKHHALSAIAHTRHFIGHLQTNKVKELLKYDVACLQSLDRLELAQKLDERLATAGRTMDVLIQVNTSNEKSKFGVQPKRALELVNDVAQLKQLKIRGLMTIGVFSSDAHQVRQCFRLLKSLQETIRQAGIQGVVMKELSMGMSGDLEIAVEEGATIVRVGTAVFGKRTTEDSYYWNENK
ncbi:YggS family pyridoxal phosphate-dependent enzyme [Pedobacter sp. SYP-B3415]|uniref:YggS family pyridoxal phosphate-dependent enzyme n=1 Tax=Pedobacter sp. SYP-B3415 TaxID=2496641 RepID=UPI00101BAD71|nr:YggS family pyridoxal phosphate-dependent enzyme [Pedobacter sp. SYP-B3415]